MNLLIDTAFKGTAILLVGWAASLALRRASAGVRHTIWLFAMLAVAALPAALLIPPGAIPAVTRIVLPAVVAAASPQVAARGLPWLFLIWTIGAGLVLTRLIAGIVAAMNISRRAVAIDGILYSDLAVTPMTWGFFRPFVILPAYTREWTDAQRAPVIRHERAHVTRHDWLWQMLATAMTAVFWFHPLMWLAAFQLRREAEGAADDLVLSNGVPPADYADRLLVVARRMPGFSVPAAVIPMVKTPALETRVRSILDPSRRRSSAGILVRCTIALAAVAFLFPVAVTRQRVYAQGKVYKVGKGVSQPSILYKVDPDYTPEAKADGIEGTVRLGVEITPVGVAENIHVLKSLDPGLDANAVTAVSQWRFKPGVKDGGPVTVAATIELTFHLE